MSIKVDRVPENVNFPQEEEKILEFWKRIDAFQTCLKHSKGKPRYSFYDGPPFATGLPHYGHILAGTIKDVVTRYAHQQGYHVERRFGWDCHGLPVEFEIDKILGIKGPEDVAKMGIDKYNAECRKIVMRYAADWEKIVTRMGRWIDFKNDYKTLYPWFMESIWWAFKQLFLKGLVYQGVKVMPYSTACNTPLSNFESGQNYKDVVDPAIVVTFPIEGGVSLIAWTTTPWTLPSNLALCVNPKLNYVKIKDNSSGNVYIVQENRIEAIFKDLENITVLETFLGIKLKGTKYVPLFDYFASQSQKGAFQVLADNYVTNDTGTGIVHQAPYFGEDDYRVCLAAGVIARDQEIICPVDASGKFVLPVSDFAGQHVKDADKNIIAYLKKKGRLLQSGQTKHSYPFCWRSDTPLIYKAVPSWFIRVEQLSQNLINCTSSTYWVPDFVREKRFGNWLKEARDWAVSRNRYWGTPIPIWMSPDGEEIVCVGSIEELNNLTGANVTDIHRENIDHLTIPSVTPGKPPLKRISEVFDCWFESGSMPYAQNHYPFEKNKEFEECFPADFVAEGIDQTRGWFYTLMVMSTALFNRPPFKNLIANGLILASDGQKMSKSKKNYPDPLEVVKKYGADALRLYLINSPVVRAENLRFKEEGVRDVIKDVFLPWYNAYRFLMQNIERIVQEDGVQYVYDDKLSLTLYKPENVMDKWILSFTQSLLAFVKQEMAAYRLYTVVPKLTKFIDNLTNWFVRMNRKRLKGENGVTDCHIALDTLCRVLYDMVCLMAPFTPFLSELMHQTLSKVIVGTKAESIHYVMLPNPQENMVDLNIERAVQRMQSVIELGRVVRDRKTIPIKYPLPEMVIVHQDEQYLMDIKSLEKYVLEELNVRKVTLSQDKNKYGITLRAEPDHKTLGSRLKGDFKAITQALKNLTDAQCQKIVCDGSLVLLNHKLDISEIRLIFQVTSGNDRYEVHSDNDVLILLDTSPNQEMIDEGVARELINRIQKLRKKAHLVPTDEVNIYYSINDPNSDVQRITSSHKAFIESAIKAPIMPMNEKITVPVIIKETQDLKGVSLEIVITSRTQATQPTTPWVNVQLSGLASRYGAVSDKGMLLIENNGSFITLDQLYSEITAIFGLYGCKFELFVNKVKLTDNDIRNLHGKVVIVAQRLPSNTVDNSPPFCKFVNNPTCKIIENPVGVELL